MSVAVSSSPVTYQDPKRYGWLLSITVPMVMWAGPLLYHFTGHAASFWVPVIVFYLVFPAMDFVAGVDTSNPPETAVPAMEADPYYRAVAYTVLPLLWFTFFGAIWIATTWHLPWWAIVPVIMGGGSAVGFAINVAHELGHKNTGRDLLMAQLALAPSGYGHFTVDHNRGHHSAVGTPEDPASARMGENVFAFALREGPGVFRRGWRLEKERLARTGRSAWSVHNQILQPLAMTIILWGAVLVWLGWRALPFLVVCSLWGNFQLTSANYVEHYGLGRIKLPNGRYEPCAPQHSWNSDHKLSNYALLHLQRHSDHHAWPTRSYQTLRRFPDLPQLPNGYFGMFVLAYVPPLFFRIMDKRLLDAIGHDPSRINFKPEKRDTIIRKFALQQRGA